MNPMNKTRTLSFRLAEDDYQKLVERCRVSELSQSKYLRYLIRIPMLAEAAKGEIPDGVVIDRKTMRQMSREFTRWGYHYNQAVHAMNSINYYIVHGKATTELIAPKAETIETELAAVNENAERIVYELARIQCSTIMEA